MVKRVLVVEDYDDTREMMRIMIEKYGYSVLEASGPYEAIEKASEFHPDLILMDIGLPLMDGLTTAEAIIGKEGTANPNSRTSEVCLNCSPSRCFLTASNCSDKN